MQPDSMPGLRSSVSAVIPVYNRARCIGRAIASAIRQRMPPLEIIVVDDDSTDDSCAVVAAISARDSRIRLLRQESNRGGAAARNVGLMAARAEFVAFLDSDDEWLGHHLERRLAVLQAAPQTALVHGSFYVDHGSGPRVQRCAPLRGDPLEYLFAGRGGLRTSTFVGRRSALLEVHFDDTLRKHQDWDLALNFRRRFLIATDPEPSVVLHASSSDRLSSKLDHASSLAFYSKNHAHASRTGWGLFCTVMLERTYHSERRSLNFQRYLDLLRTIDPRAHSVVRRLTPLLAVPGIGGRLFRSACREWFFAFARGREQTVP
jgi:glycosyltransferase involved in cell wall biosynthesis